MLIYVAIGLVIGLLESMGFTSGALGSLTLLLSVAAATTLQTKLEPQWQARWWQPALIAIASSIVVFFSRPALKHLHESRTNKAR
jgi:hypothetical protein